MGTIIAQRYRVVASIGKGSFSRVVQCLDLHEKMMVSVKVLRNDKDCMDQGLGEVRLLALIGQHDARGEQPLLSMLDYFYYKEHLLIVTELLRDSVFNFYRYLSNFLRPTFCWTRKLLPYQGGAYCAQQNGRPEKQINLQDTSNEKNVQNTYQYCCCLY